MSTQQHPCHACKQYQGNCLGLQSSNGSTTWCTPVYTTSPDDHFGEEMHHPHLNPNGTPQCDDWEHFCFGKEWVPPTEQEMDEFHQHANAIYASGHAS